MDESKLIELLKIPSPSGHEATIQSKWLDDLKDAADELATDNAGNAIARINPDSPYQVLLAGHCDEIGFLVKSIDENGFVFVEKLGGISHKPALGMSVQIHGKNGIMSGVMGTNAEHHGGASDSFSMDDLFIDCGAQSAETVKNCVQIGDPVTYEVEPMKMNSYISGRGLDNRTGSFIVAEVIRRLAIERPDVGVCGVSTVNEETNMGGAYFAGAQIKPDMAIAIDVTFATDYPGVNKQKHGDVRLGKGPVLAKGAPINLKMNRLLETVAKEKDIPLQYELTPRRTGTDADQLRLTGKGVPVALVSLPLRYMHAPREVASLQDMEQEIDLLVGFIQKLTVDQDVKPVSLPK
ncbi:endoglucanase [Alkalihalobacillus xiaoxiensis]|uniref:Endoglucanase n=1 Tax=Shouchella xiaoxiensis TaxID=766895 RepID=A0ABS2SZ49_9BACI|nr:endoglucanase [Shouchella xiaoxiensis]